MGFRWGFDGWVLHASKTAPWVSDDLANLPFVWSWAQPEISHFRKCDVDGVRGAAGFDAELPDEGSDGW